MVKIAFLLKSDMKEPLEAFRHRVLDELIPGILADTTAPCKVTLTGVDPPRLSITPYKKDALPWYRSGKKHHPGNWSGRTECVIPGTGRATATGSRNPSPVIRTQLAGGDTNSWFGTSHPVSRPQGHQAGRLYPYVAPGTYPPRHEGASDVELHKKRRAGAHCPSIAGPGRHRGRALQMFGGSARSRSFFRRNHKDDPQHGPYRP